MRVDYWMELILDTLSDIINVRALAVSAFYWIGCAMFNVDAGKGAILFFITYVAQVLPLGRLRIERFGLVFVFLASIYWVDIVPIKKYVAIANEKIIARLSL